MATMGTMVWWQGMYGYQSCGHIAAVDGDLMIVVDAENNAYELYAYEVRYNQSR